MAFSASNWMADKSLRFPGHIVIPSCSFNSYVGSRDSFIALIQWHLQSVCQVGGKFRSVKKCREIAQGATDALREGQSLETVRSMVVSYTSLVLFCIL